MVEESEVFGSQEACYVFLRKMSASVIFISRSIRQIVDVIASFVVLLQVYFVVIVCDAVEWCPFSFGLVESDD